ncbi:hypothetical protein DM02DRAFT_727095 [Periconia macrospinosa]|uniref:Lytic polysaccharide monooxygenase n=1 Tax=Periconia macrospinosa TaxID=97972 RepID=A0A2V1DWN8_9PLEO|nr:hypothetical protein DM02DRAFT_727095 [Periconia macrospinosa]
MRSTSRFLILALSVVQLTSRALAQHSHITPCLEGFGTELNGCGGCNKTKAIEVTSWDVANYVTDFDMPKAGVEDGGGYNVWWNVEQPGAGCRIMIFEPFKDDEGKNPQTRKGESASVVSRAPGNIVLSTAQSGCFVARVPRKFFVGACCWKDCDIIGAIPSPEPQNQKRSEEVETKSFVQTRAQSEGKKAKHSRIHRARRSPNTINLGNLAGGGGDAPAPPRRECTIAHPVGSTYVRSGRQQIAGYRQSCRTPECEYKTSVTTSVSSTITSETGTENMTGEGLTIGVQAGMNFLAGPSVSASVESSHEWSKTIVETMSRSDTNTTERTTEFSFKLISGGTYAGYFTPDLTCQKFRLNCQEIWGLKSFGQLAKFETVVERCDPARSGEGIPFGEHGITTIN